ncbi:MAG TPA: hypothetical protein VLA78_10335 [Paracoccaceae bacterium]|nr:hypothetical protein [Paracoccaceae bacterium]
MTLPWRSAATIALASILLVVVVRLRPPTDWVLTHFTFTYDVGFQRRALFGDLLAWLTPDGITRAAGNGVAVILTLVSTALIVAFVWRRCRVAQGAAGGLWLVLFATSLGLATWIGNTGYLDTLAILPVLAALSLDTTRPSRVVTACALVAGASLFHENALPYFAPLVAADIWLRNAGRPLPQRMAAALAPLGAGIAGTWAILHFGTHPADMLPQLRALSEARSLDFPAWPSAVDVLAHLPPGARSTFDLTWSNGFYAIWLSVFILFGLIVLVPTVVLVLAAARHRPLPDRLAIAAAILAPLSLMFVAFEVSRFIAVAMLNAYLVGALLLRHDAAFAAGLARVLTPANVIVLLMLHGHLMLQDMNRHAVFYGGAPGALFTQVSWFTGGAPVPGPADTVDPAAP